LDGAAGTFANIEMASDLVYANYVFGVVDGGGNFFDQFNSNIASLSSRESREG
jgi:hypothetical protein